MSDAPLDVFSYRPPNAISRPLFDLINRTEQEALLVLTAAALDDDMTFDLITRVARRFWRVIEASCPHTDDRNRALTAVRLFRMRANDLIKNPAKDEVSDQYRSQSVTEQLADARMWACSAVALWDDKWVPAGLGVPNGEAIALQCADPDWNKLVGAAKAKLA